MPHKARSHLENLSRVCYLCLNKAGKHAKKITERLESAMKEIDVSYFHNIPDRPSVLCTNCYIRLNKGLHSSYVDYNNVLIREKRNQDKCTCPICIIASSNVSSPIPFEVSTMMIPKNNPPTKSAASDSSVLKICGTCNGEVRRGVSHKCTKQNKVLNTLTLTTGVEHQVAAQIIHNESLKGGSSTISLNKGRGVHTNVTIKRKRDASETKTTISSSVLNEIQLNCNMSTNSVKKMCASLRSVDKNLVEPNAISKLQDTTHELDEFFDSMILTNISTTKYSENGYPFIFCKNLPGLVAHLIDKRSILSNFHCKIGVDSGQKSLKVIFFCILLVYFLTIRLSRFVCRYSQKTLITNLKISKVLVLKS